MKIVFDLISASSYSVKHLPDGQVMETYTVPRSLVEVYLSLDEHNNAMEKNKNE